ncbi:MAG: translation initiation factor IF-5A [Euryarchaeota archaeon]|nr:translation initiation factor IF-5A [Euryarchaeota archaeon]
MKELAEVRTLKENRYMLVDEEPCRIISITTSKPGKHGSAKARIDAVSIFTGNKRSVVFSVTDKVYVPMIDKRKAQVLSISGDHAQLMDTDTYDTFDMEIPEEFRGTIQAGEEIGYLEAMGRRMITKV